VKVWVLAKWALLSTVHAPLGVSVDPLALDSIGLPGDHSAVAAVLRL
jgi:hypothetical protein